MSRRVKIYEAERGDERITGTAREVAERIGAGKISIYSAVLRAQKLYGWTVRQVGVKDRRIQYAAYYALDETREDPVVGDAEEVAEVIGILTPSYLSEIADTGRITKHGYYIETLKGGDES